MQIQDFPNPNFDNNILLSIQSVIFWLFFSHFDSTNLNGKKIKCSIKLF